MLSRHPSKKSHPHRHHHHNHFPPREYTDLSRPDIESLSTILGPIPTPSTSAAASHQARSKQLIADLPAHLRAKIPKLSTFCSKHDKLNPLPIIDLLHVVQSDLQAQALEKWRGTRLPLRRMQNVSAIWTDPKTFYQVYGRQSDWAYHSHRCAACKLSIIANDADAVLWLGAITIAMLSPKDWSKSKRILWFEEWLKACGEGEEIKRMWDEGTCLREVVKQKKDEDGGRPWVKAYAKHAMEAGAEAGARSEMLQVSDQPRRPPRSPTQDDHVEFVAKAMQMLGENPFNDPVSPTTTAVPSLRSAVSATNNFEDEKDRSALESDDEDQDDEDLHPGFARLRHLYVASSVYSQTSHETITARRPPATKSRKTSLRVNTGRLDVPSFRLPAQTRVSENAVIDAYAAGSRYGTRQEKFV